jgi:hypothetical protein
LDLPMTFVLVWFARHIWLWFYLPITFDFHTRNTVFKLNSH